jgi:hypothetical protein
MNSKNNIHVKIHKLIKRSRQDVVFFLMLSLVLIGTWCVPPKWTEKVVHELKAKYLIEMMIEKDT